MPSSPPQSLHGHVADSLGGFSRLLPANPDQPPQDVLAALSTAMSDSLDTVDDAPDPEENLYVPAGYTYLGQFVDHDLTFDTTSSLDLSDDSHYTNERTAAFDLDNVYGPGPDAAPYMYLDGIRLVEGEYDLPRQAGRAIIGDPRDDENSIVCNLQMAFLRFHNAVVDRLERRDPALRGTRRLFDLARMEVRWTYQRLLVEDFLPRIVSNETLQAFEVRRDPDALGRTRNEAAYALFTADKRDAIPIEFAGAAYRFGHSMVRNGYRLTDDFKAAIFVKDSVPDDSLVGFAPLPLKQVITDWSRFYPEPGVASREPGHKDAANAATSNDLHRLQFAYRIDPTVVNPLAHLPASVAAGGPVNLAFRNLMRGRKFQLPTGQAVGETLGVPVLDADELLVRDKSQGKDRQTFMPLSRIDPELARSTPLWFYVLAEAQRPVVDWWISRGKGTFSESDLLDAASVTATQLGETGGRIVLEVFHGLLDADPSSCRNHPAAATWQPLIRSFRMWDLVNLEFGTPEGAAKKT
jgi:hypothetical protein